VHRVGSGWDTDHYWRRGQAKCLHLATVAGCVVQRAFTRQSPGPYSKVTLSVSPSALITAGLELLLF